MPIRLFVLGVDVLARFLVTAMSLGCLQFASAATPPAFPEAMGFGKNATGGRAGTVYHVTHLGDAGVGSFRDAVSKPGRIVVFDVGGYIQLQSAVSISSNMTIAGQTAPGQGIGFRGGKLSTGKQSNIIMRHLRIRPGSETASQEDVAINLYNARNIILDHMSIEFAPWNNIGGVSDDWQNYPVTDITIQNSLIANPIYQQFGAHCESVNSNWSWYYNAFANSHNRNPLDKVNDVFVNNILYNYEAGYTTHTSTLFKHDIIGNYFIFGPATGTDNTWYQVDKNQSIYYAGNMKDKTMDGQLNGAATTPYWYQGEGTVLSAPWSSVTQSHPIYSAASAYRIVTSWSGTLPYDPMDSLIWNQVQTLGKGNSGQGAGSTGPATLYTSQAQTGLANNGYGSISGGTRPADFDNDGMPDFWENAMGSNAALDDAMTVGADGYARVEKYINWLGSMHGRVSRNESAQIDLRAFTQGFQTVAPTYSVSGAVQGTVSVSGYSAQFVPAADFTGLGSFQFTVKGTDGTNFTSTVYMLVEPGSNAVKPARLVYNLATGQSDKSWENLANWTPASLPTALDTAVIHSGEAQVGQTVAVKQVRVESAGIYRVSGSSLAVPEMVLQGGTLKSYTSNPLYRLTTSLEVTDSSTLLVGSTAASTFELAATLQGAGSLAKTGVGTLLLAQPSPGFAGNWSVLEGSLKAGAAHAVGKGTVRIDTGATFEVAVAGALGGSPTVVLSRVDGKCASLILNAADTVASLVMGSDTVAQGTYFATDFPACFSGSFPLTVLHGEPLATASAPLEKSDFVLQQHGFNLLYSIPTAGDDLVALDLRGREIVRTRLQTTQGSVDLQNLEPGSYFFVIEHNHVMQAPKLIYLP